MALTPQTVRHEGTLHELVFPEAYSTVRMKIVFPGTRSRSNDIEIYELEPPVGRLAVYVEVHPLGGAFNRAILGNFMQAFAAER